MMGREDTDLDERASASEGRSSSHTRDPRLPNFLVIGAMKSGTTSLFHYLQAHPQVSMSPLKEVDFFIEEGNWSRGLDWYRRQFDDDPKAVAIGEASTSYTKYPEYEGVPERIEACLPEVRLIYVVRDPIERIRSHYQHRVLAGSEREPLEDAVVRDPSYLNCSRYALQLERYLERFRREQILVITSEELRASRAATVARVYDFIGAEAAFLPDVLEQEFYKTQERASYPPFVWSVRRFVKRHLPAGKRAKEFVDSVLPRSVGRLSKRAPASDDQRSAPLSDALHRRLTEALSEDVRKLRAYMPEGFDGWGIG